MHRGVGGVLASLPNDAITYLANYPCSSTTVPNHNLSIHGLPAPVPFLGTLCFAFFSTLSSFRLPQSIPFPLHILACHPCTISVSYRQPTRSTADTKLGTHTLVSYTGPLSSPGASLPTPCIGCHSIDLVPIHIHNQTTHRTVSLCSNVYNGTYGAVRVSSAGMRRPSSTTRTNYLVLQWADNVCGPT